MSVQPDFGDIPSQLLAGADVSKSPMANLLNAGITGTIDLKTRRPYDLPQGWTLAGAASALHGSQTKKYQPEFNTLVGYHADRWGIVASAAYSDVTLEHSFDGMGQYTGELVGETSDNTTLGVGFLNAYGGAPLPAGVVLLTPSLCPRGSDGLYSPAPGFETSGCDVDVNGDGRANGVYYNTADYAAIDEQLERKRLGFNVSLQAELGPGVTLLSDLFYTTMKRATIARPAISSIPPAGTVRRSCRSPSATLACRSITATTIPAPARQPTISTPRRAASSMWATSRLILTIT